MKTRRKLFLGNLGKFHSNPSESKLEIIRQLDMGDLNASEQVYFCLLEHTKCPDTFLMWLLLSFGEIATSASYCDVVVIKPLLVCSLFLASFNW